MDFVYFIVLVGVLIFVHELGHFAWAKFFDVKVLRFSLGFGPRLAGFRRGETEYVLAAVPLGGYVNMLGESPSDAIRPEDENRAFHSQPLYKRLIIVVAGPAMNLMFPVALYFVVFLGDGVLSAPVVGTVVPGHPAHGKLKAGDRVVTIDGEPMESFFELHRTVRGRPNRSLRLTLDRDGKRVVERITPRLARVLRDPVELQRYEDVGRIGISRLQPAPVLGIADPGSPAAVAGLRTFDYVVSAAGEPIDTWVDLERLLDRNPGITIPLTYLRPARVPHALGGLIEMEVFEPRVATLTPEVGDASGVMRAGVEPADLYVSEVELRSPEHRMGLLPGDRLVQLDGVPLRHFGAFLRELEVGRGREHELVWRRGKETHRAKFRLKHERSHSDTGAVYDRYVVGMRNWVPTRPPPPIENPHPVRYAWSRALEDTWELVEVTTYSILRLLQGRLSVETIGGPLTVFEVAGVAAREGARDYLRLMALISVNLGIINLLPIPILDGGHLLFFFIEAVSRRRTSVRVRRYASLAGLLVLVVLMILAFKNDVERRWPSTPVTVSSP